MRNQLGFTLIELLIVVAIIAILAAIAVPNFLEAQVRAKVVSVRNDFRSINVAMQAYRVDNNDYPSDELGTGWANDYLTFIPLTTPIAYLSSIPTNPFFDAERSSEYWQVPPRGNYSYYRNDYSVSTELGIFYHFTSCGPDMKHTLGPTAYDVYHRTAVFVNELYDPTNGTKSNGDLHCSNLGISF